VATTLPCLVLCCLWPLPVPSSESVCTSTTIRDLDFSLLLLVRRTVFLGYDYSVVFISDVSSREGSLI
jgi:hypothetical protein